MRKILIFSIISALLLTCAASCAWMGRTAGKAVAIGQNAADSIGGAAESAAETVDEKTDLMKEGYEQGYEEKRKK